MSGKKLKLFIDASVFIAASASKEGGSAALLKIYQKVPFTPVTTHAILNESELNMKAKLEGSKGLVYTLYRAYKQTAGPGAFPVFLLAF